MRLLLALFMCAPLQSPTPAPAMQSPTPAPGVPSPATALLRHPGMTLYYIPFVVDTVVPVTGKTIREKAHFRIVVTTPERVEAMNVLLADRKPASRFDQYNIRLLVVTDSPGAREILVDALGRVRDQDGDAALSPSAWKSLENVMAELTAGKKARGER